MKQQDPDLLREQFSSRIKTKYHQVLRQPNPNSDNILSLALLMTNKNIWQASNNLLEKKIDLSTLTEQQSKQYDLIIMRNNIGIYYASSNLVKDNRNLKINVLKQLQKIDRYKNLSNLQLQTVAKNSADFGLFPLAIKYYYQLANQDSTYQAQWYAKAGQCAIQTGDYAGAADAFKSAGDSLHQTTNFNKYTDKWLKASINAKQFEQIKPFLTNIAAHPPKSLAIIEKMANISYQAGFYTIASELFSTLALRDNAAQKQRWYEKASYWAAKAENYDIAASYLIKAKEITNSDNDRWVIQQRLIDIYIKNKKHQLALGIILPILKQSPENKMLSNKAIYIALKNKNIALARKLNKNYLQAEPNSLNALNNQVEIEILAKKYAQAIYYVKKIIKINPYALKPRQQWARLEEQEGNYPLALELRQWIYSIDKKPEHFQKIIQLAQLDIKGIGLKILQELALQQELPTQAIYDVFFHLLNSGQKKSAEKFLSHYLERYHAEKKLLVTLAKWYSGEKRYTESLQTWNKVEKYFGRSKISALNKFELLWELKHKRQAYRLWLSNYRKWNKYANTRQLSLMAEIAWQNNHTKTALSYYNRLLNKHYKGSAKERPLQYMRIAILNKKLGRPRTALSIYRKGFIQTKDSNLLINGLQLSFDQQDAYNFKRLTSLAKKYNRQFRSNSRYWLLQAANAQRNKHYRTALKYYKTVLSLKPKSHEAHTGVRAIKRHLRS
jgi:tetratricopeptide (TPR) repeat protein